MTDFCEGENEVFIRYEGDKKTNNSSGDDDFDDEEEIDVAAGRRWDPLGKEKDNDETVVDQMSRHENVDDNNSQIKQLETEQELLSTSLQALTSHFAQVQFRLRQIVESPAIDRDSLLQSLEEFAFRGIPEVMRLNPREHENLYKIMERQQNRQFELIEHLKQQLSDAEQFAYESGADILPQSIVVEKQKAIINELKTKLKLRVDDEFLPLLTEDDIRAQVDSAIGEFVTPLKMQDTLVSQLKTQIVDLERFVAYLQDEQEMIPEIKAAIKNCKNPEIAFQTYNSKMARSRKQSQSDGGNKEQKSNAPGTSRSDYNSGQQSRVDHDLSGKVSNLLIKASAILDMFALTQLGCGSQRIQRNSLKKTPKGNHWGDLRAQLEVDVQEIISMVSSIEKLHKEEKAIQECNTSDTDDYDDDDTLNNLKSKRKLNQTDKEYIATMQVEITALVRKQFAITLQGLMQHGLRDSSKTSTGLVPFIGCMLLLQQPTPHRRVDETEERPNQQMHVWELILEYYHIKNGDQFNDTPARKLSESFNLDIMGLGSQSSSNKHTLLTVIGSIIALHAPYKRSYNSHFKAFISAALNARKLTHWLNLIYQSQDLIEQYYTDWSYVAHTGFRDALRTIDRLSHHDFDLPVDLAVRQFQNIKDIF